MYYFGYCTWLSDAELRRYLPECTPVVKAWAANNRLVFHTAGERMDRGWCHLDDSAAAHGFKAGGAVFEHDPKYWLEDYDDFKRVFLTVMGEDSVAYDCWTYRMTSPGAAMRPPEFYWAHIENGLNDWKFPEAYIAEVKAMKEASLPCPRADRPNPSAIPGKSAETR